MNELSSSSWISSTMRSAWCSNSMMPGDVLPACVCAEVQGAILGDPRQPLQQRRERSLRDGPNRDALIRCNAPRIEWSLPGDIAYVAA